MSTDRVCAHLLADDGTIPNSRLPLLIYPGAFLLSYPDVPGAIEARLRRNGWQGGWRNGIHPHHHYHSTAHEVLAVYGGSARVQFGGESGIIAEVRSGDAVVIPAGVGQTRIWRAAGFRVVGAYPRGQTWDMCYGSPAESDREPTRTSRASPCRSPIPSSGETDRCLSIGAERRSRPVLSPWHRRTTARWWGRSRRENAERGIRGVD